MVQCSWPVVCCVDGYDAVLMAYSMLMDGYDAVCVCNMPYDEYDTVLVIVILIGRIAVF